jgi:hypothetical protein
LYCPFKYNLQLFYEHLIHYLACENCTIKPGWICTSNHNCTSVCGDNLVIADEECDNGEYGCVNCKARDG